jgi:hypothetical protein
VLIRAYRFGRIEVDGRAYTSDVIITPERVVDTWWRREGHNLVVADLADVVEAKPDIVVLGTGYFGRMAVSKEARLHLESQGIRLRVARTRQAVETFNQLQNQRSRVVAALHLTC